MLRRFLIAVLASLSAPFATGADLMFAPPKGALDASHVVLQPGVVEQDHFWLNEAYPSSSAIDHYSRVFTKWRACRSTEEGWSSFGDLANGPARFVHQLTRYWASPSNDVAVTVALRYTSSGFQHRENPDNNRQLVIVLRHKWPNASAELASMGVKCEPGT